MADLERRSGSERQLFSQLKKKNLLSGLMDLSRHRAASLLNTSEHTSVETQQEPDNKSSTTTKTEYNTERTPSTSVSHLLGIYSDLQAISGRSVSDTMEVVDVIARDHQGIDRLRQIYENICGVRRHLVQRVVVTRIF
jgi:hypothetical protein